MARIECFGLTKRILHGWREKPKVESIRFKAGSLVYIDNSKNFIKLSGRNAKQLSKLLT